MTRGLKAALGVVVAGAFVAGAWYAGPGSGKAAAPASAPKKAKYACPMHPQYTSDRPGVAPCCGMQMELVKEEAGPVQVTAETQRLLGVRVEAAQRTSGGDFIRLLGRVAADEARVYRLSAAVDGFVREVAPPAAGSVVRKGDLLARLFSRDVLTPQQGYVYALATRDRMRREAGGGGGDSDPAAVQIYTAEQNLIAMGMSEHQIHALEKTRAPQTIFELRAPIDGLVLARNVALGLRTERNLELYRLADLSRVWVLADLFGPEAALVRPGARARIHHEGRVLAATVSDAIPQFDPSSRTLKLRLEVDNPDLSLRPEMFVDVEAPVRLPPSVTVPADAILDSGMRKIVYVDRGEGDFEPREVETGWRLHDRVSVTHGLREGERVVVAGAFLVDSESRMKQAR
jgi:Cu(I)/Ag(I) efflux system membrane fusion protein